MTPQVLAGSGSPLSPVRLVVLSAILLGLGAATVPAGTAAVDLIQPGDLHQAAAGQCTLNFVFDGQGSLAGKVYIGTAAHCITQGVGESASTTGHANFGTVAYTGDVGASVNGGAARENGIPGNQLDFALIEVKPALHALVDAEVIGHPGWPVGYTKPRETASGDLIYPSGWGIVFRTTDTTREDRVGALYNQNARAWIAEVPVTPGDSGGPMLHESGKALGINSGTSTGVAVPPHFWHGPTVDAILTEMAGLGYPLALRNA